MTAGSVWLLVKVSTFNKYDNYLSSLSVYDLHKLSGQLDIDTYQSLYLFPFYTTYKKNSFVTFLMESGFHAVKFRENI